MSAKQTLRKEMLRRLSGQRPEERSTKSGIIKDKLFSLEEFRDSKNIFCFISLPAEVETKEIIKGALKLGKKVFAPVIDGDRLKISELVDMDRDMERGPLGVLQPGKHSPNPFSPERLDIVLVPGVAFDGLGNRLGRGKGYFDKFLKELPENVKTIGLAFDFQVLKSIPTDSHDIPVRSVISN